jgi:membrane-associated progesterone receptor component
MGNEVSSAEEQLAKEAEPTRGYSRPDLTQYNGVDNERILIALKGTVYNVTQGKAFYGPGGSYHIFAGRDASRGLAKMSLEVKDVDDPSIDDLNLSEIDAMNNWAEKLAAKYPIVGHLVVPMEERDYTLEELAQYNGKGWLICWFVGWLGWLGWLGCWSPKRAKKTSCLFVQCLVSYLCFLIVLNFHSLEQARTKPNHWSLSCVASFTMSPKDGTFTDRTVGIRSWGVVMPLAHWPKCPWIPVR